MKKYLLSIFLALPLLSMAQEETTVTEVTEVNPIAEISDSIATPAEPVAQAPQFRFGVVNKSAILESMPEYAKVEQEMDALKASFEAEAKRSADEFNAKYEAFLNEQRNYAPSIMRKRQAELEEMMRSNENFRTESHRLLREAREKALKPLRARINEMITVVAEENNLLFVLNGERDAVPYFQQMVGIDITEQVKAKCQ